MKALTDEQKKGKELEILRAATRVPCIPLPRMAAV